MPIYEAKLFDYLFKLLRMLKDVLRPTITHLRNYRLILSNWTYIYQNSQPKHKTTYREGYIIYMVFLAHLDVGHS